MARIPEDMDLGYPRLQEILQLTVDSKNQTKLMVRIVSDFIHAHGRGIHRNHDLSVHHRDSVHIQDRKNIARTETDQEIGM